MKHVIIGGSAAGMSCAETLRRLDPKCEITVVSEENHPFYSRCMTTYYIAGKIEESAMLMREPGFYESRRINVLVGKKAASVDPERKTLNLDDGTELGYDRLLLATGGSAKIPDIPGARKRGVFKLRTWEDAAAIAARARLARKAVLVGGGLIGMKAACALHEVGLEVRVVISSGRVLSQMLDDVSSAIARETLVSRGFVIDTRCDVVEIEGGEEVRQAVLSDGRRVDADLVVIGKGVDPEVGLAESCGARIGRGIVVNEHLQTSVPGVYAAGDVAEAYDVAYETPRVNAMWTAATAQGRVAAYNMAGIPTRYPGSVGMNSIDIFGLPFISMGVTSPREPGYTELVRKRRGDWYRKLVVKDGVIRGAIFAGGVDRAGVVLALIKKEIRRDDAPERILADDFTYATFMDVIDDKGRYFEEGGKRNVQRIMQGGY
ncbi:MAG: FAD-dependent oxidoreductase [Bacillota bacterium]